MIILSLNLMLPFERHLFRQLTQGSEETVHMFVCPLRQGAATCDFVEREEDYTRDQLIDKCYSGKLRRKFLEKEGGATLNNLLITARAQEAVNLQMEAMGRNTGSEQVYNVVDAKSGINSVGRECFNCGQVGTLQESGYALLEVERVISVEKSDNSKLNVVQGHQGIPNRDRNKAPAIAVGEMPQE